MRYIRTIQRVVCHPNCYSDKQIGADGNPNLGVNSIASGSVKGLDFKVLFDPLEEQLDVPSFPIEFGYGDGREFKIVGDETIDNAR